MLRKAPIWRFTQDIFKRNVHPKMNILSSFSHLQVVPNLYEFLSSVKHKKIIFWRMLVTKQLTVAIDFHSMKKKYYESQWLLTVMRVGSYLFLTVLIFCKVMLVCCTMTERSMCLWQHGFVYHPQACLLGLRPNEQSQTGSSLRFHFWKSSRSSIRKQSQYPNLCRVLEPRVCKIQKKPSQFRPAEVIIQCEAARQARPQTNLCWYPSLIWSDALFVWMSHPPT